MHRRSGFTITEMLVSMALIMFIMVILSEAFVAALESFRQLKAVGDMETNLRTAATILRRDLQADHFLNGTPPSSTAPLRLNNLLSGSTVPGGFFRVGITLKFDTADLATPLPTAGATIVTLVNPPSSLSSLGPGMQVNFLGGTNETVFTDQSYTPGANPIILAPPGLANGGHNKAQWPSFPSVEGTDADGLQSFSDNGYLLHFSVNQSGNPYSTEDIKLKRRESYFTAALTGGAIGLNNLSTDWPLRQSVIPPASMSAFDTNTNASIPLPAPMQTAFTAQIQGGAAPFDSGQPPFNDAASYYTPFAEIGYFLRDSGATIPGSTKKLFTLYRRQLAVLAPGDAQPSNTPMNGIPATVFPPKSLSPAAYIPVAAFPTPNSSYFDFSWIPVFDPQTKTYFMHFNSMADLLTPTNRSLTYGNTHAADPTAFASWIVNPPPPLLSDSMPIIGDRGEPATVGGTNYKGADVLLTNVINMTVRVKRKFQNSMDADFIFLGFDTANFAASPFQIIAIEVILRVWDQKTQRTRQLTIVQNL